jgi:hypothetical protein
MGFVKNPAQVTLAIKIARIANTGKNVLMLQVEIIKSGILIL